MSKAAALPASTWQYSEPARRTLLIRVKKNGDVSALWCTLRGDVVTHRHSLPPITGENARAVYSEVFSRVEFNFVCVRVWRDGRWVSPLRNGGAGS